MNDVNNMEENPKCWKCKKRMELVKEKVDGIEFHAYKCPDCGESITTMEQLHELSEKYKERNQKVFQVTVTAWGGSMGIRIPKELAKKYDIDPGERIMLLDEEKGIKVIV